MGIRNNKKVMFILCLSLVLVVAGIFAFTIYQYLTHIDSIETNDTSQNTLNKQIGAQVRDASTQVGNANYFNKNNGKYYADSNYQTEANDNTAYLLSLFTSNKSVDLPEGNFLCKTRIVLNGKELKVNGVEGKTKIVFDSITFNNYGVAPFSECLIINSNYADEYKQESAQNININGIIFEYKRYSQNSPKTIMLYKNIAAANITNCSFIADYANEMVVNNLDLYNGCKNVVVSNCYFSNKTNAQAGGCIWIRNLTSKTQNIQGNTTENININNCSFEKDSKDEVISVYSTVGDVKDVIISSCDIKDYSEKQNIVLSVYSSDDNNYGIVDNVVINNNNIYTQKFNAFVILTGTQNRIKPTTNVTITNNKITSESQNDKTKTIIYNDTNNKDSNVIVNNNEIVVRGSTYYAAIANVKYVGGNKITGSFNSSIVGGIVTNNTIIGASNGIVDPAAALNNSISQVNYGIRLYSGDSNLNSNSIELKGSGICGIEVTSQDYVTCNKNKVQTLNKNQYGIIAKNANTILNNNQLLGEGKNSIK